MEKSSVITVELLFPSFVSFCFTYFWWSVVGCRYAYNCHSFLIDWPFYHYEIALFISNNILIDFVYFVILIILISFGVCITYPFLFLHFLKALDNSWHRVANKMWFIRGEEFGAEWTPVWYGWMYGWIPLQSTWNYHIVNWLHSDIK